MKRSMPIRVCGLAVVAAMLFSGQLLAREADSKTAKKLDLNTASATQLEELPGIGPSLAKKIIAGRTYKTIDDLSKAGVSSSEIRKITSRVTVSSATTESTSTKSAAKSTTTSKELQSTGKETKPALVDLNTATSKQLEDLPGVGSSSAKKIIAARPYKSVSDLSKAKLSSRTIARIKPLVTVGESKTTYTVSKPVTKEKIELVDLNAAKESALEEVPGIDTAYARKIIAGRPYKTIDDVAKAGIPESTIIKIRSLVTVGRKAEAPPQKGMVWVNIDTKRYHKEGSRWYGATKSGKWMTEADAIKAGYRGSKQ